MNCIIIADKFNKGMKSKGCNGLIPINKKSNLFQNQYRVIKKVFPSSKIIYIYGFESKKIRNYLTNNYDDVVSVHNKDFDTSGYIKSLSCASKYLGNSSLIFFGDLILSTQMFKHFDKKRSQVFVNKKTKNTLGCTIDNQNFVQNISYGLDNYLTNMYYIHKKDMPSFKYYVDEDKYRNYFLFEIVNNLIDTGTQFNIVMNNNKNLCKTLSKHNGDQ